MEFLELMEHSAFVMASHLIIGNSEVEVSTIASSGLCYSGTCIEKYHSSNRLNKFLFILIIPFNFIK